MIDESAALKTSPPLTGSEPFFGWRVLVATFMAQFISASVTFAPFGVFVVPLVSDFDTTRGKLSNALSIGFLLMGLLGPLVGTLLDRGHARRAMIAGLVLCGTGLIAMSFAEELWLLGVIYCGCVCAGTAFYGMNPSMWMATQWFDHKRGLALGITVAGATVGSMITPPLAAWLIETSGWREALWILGTGALVLGVPAFAVFAIAHPDEVGQRPLSEPSTEDERTSTSTAPAASATEPIETGTLLRDMRLWLIAVGFAFVFTSPIVMMAWLVPFAEDLGISLQDAAFFFSASAPFSILSKVTFGWLSDKMPLRIAIWTVAAVNGACWALLLLDPGYSAFLMIGALYGIGIGAAGPLHAVTIARCFGPAAFGRAAGLGGLAGLPLIAATPAIAGYLFDQTASYHDVFRLEMALMLVGGLLLSIPRIPKA